MRKIILVLSAVISGCSNSTPNNNSLLSNSKVSSPSKSDTSIKITNEKKDVSSYYKIDTLSDEESKFLQGLTKENEFIIVSKLVKRYYSEDNKTLLFSKLFFSKDFLKEKGYVFFDLSFYGKISDVAISYTYNMGQASYGVGSIIGIDLKNYTHTIRSCGTTTCITQVYQNGEKVFEKDQ